MLDRDHHFFVVNDQCVAAAAPDVMEALDAK